MLMGDTAVLGPTPMQSFKGSNFAGVPQPKLVNDKAHDYSAVESPTEIRKLLLTAGVFIIIAYTVWHFMYER